MITAAKLELLDERMDTLEESFSDLNLRLGRLERIGYVIVGLMIGSGVITISEFIKAMSA